MNREQFIKDKNVEGFVNWAANYLPNINVTLNISRRGTGRANGVLGPGIKGNFVGLDAIVNAYQWRSLWTDSEGNNHVSQTWDETKNSLGQLSAWLQKELMEGNDDSVFRACESIVIWGGDRDENKGARPFLRERNENLCAYINGANNQLSLNNADTAQLDNIHGMNAMLTKVHALASTDGLPIYDSRVAGAIASLVQVYLSANNQILPDILAFPSTEVGDQRRVNGLIKRYRPNNNNDPGVLYGQTTNRERASRWASCKIRLGWLMEAIIGEADTQNNPLFNEETLFANDLVSKMHAFEAALFLIGFNVACIQ